MQRVVEYIFILMGVTLIAAMPDCELRTSWGGNACNLGGSLKVESYPNHLPVTKEKCNLYYKKEEFKEQPFFTFLDAKPCHNYTVVMVDPDAPYLKDGEYFAHVIIANIPGRNLRKGSLKKGSVILEYQGLNPPKCTGNHRYMLLVYGQDFGVRVARMVPEWQRSRFDLGAWAWGNRLCGPHSGVQFLSNFRGW